MHQLISLPQILCVDPLALSRRLSSLLLLFMVRCQHFCKVFVLCCDASTQEYFRTEEVMMSYPSRIRIRKDSHPKIAM